MPVVEARVHVDVPPELAFAVSQTSGDIRLRWDGFIREQRFLDGGRRHPRSYDEASGWIGCRLNAC